MVYETKERMDNQVKVIDAVPDDVYDIRKVQ